MIAIEKDVLAKNDQIAADNRRALAKRGITAINLMSAPGSGKTTLLEALIRRCGAERPIAVIEGDQETDRDAARIRATGCAAVQINTRTGCHLDAAMVRSGFADLSPIDGTLIFIENVGNLVCPALFDLGEAAKLVLFSVTEGEDKPLKYPHMFRAASALALTKMDLVPHLDVDVEACLAHARRVNPSLRVFRTSAKTGDGLPELADWLASIRPDGTHLRSTRIGTTRSEMSSVADATSEVP